MLRCCIPLALIIAATITQFHAWPWPKRSKKYPTILPYEMEDVTSPQLQCTHPCPDNLGNGQYNSFALTRADTIPWSAYLKIWRLKEDRLVEEECSGTIVGTRWILTAAHCIMEIPYGPGRGYVGKKSIQIHVGGLSKRAEDWPKKRSEAYYQYKGLYRSDSWYIHPEFVDEFELISDIALVRTSKEMVFNRKTKPACFTPELRPILQYEQSGYEFFVPWWGKETKGLLLTKKLLKTCERSDIVECETNVLQRKWDAILKSRSRHGGYCIAGRGNEMYPTDLGDTGAAFFATRRLREMTRAERSRFGLYGADQNICYSNIVAVLSHDLTEWGLCDREYVSFATMAQRIDGTRSKDVEWIKKTMNGEEFFDESE